MTSTRPTDPHFLDWSPENGAAAVVPAFDGLGAAVDEYRRVYAAARAAGSDSDGKGLADLREAEQAVARCLRALGWRPAGEQEPDGQAGGVRPQASGPDAQLTQSTLALVDQLAAADRASGALVERLAEGDDPDGAEVLRAARHCHGLVVDALMLGAVGLADRLGIPDSDLPL
jgi:hypothetical protein